jgi:hypothetical protein
MTKQTSPNLTAQTVPLFVVNPGSAKKEKEKEKKKHPN